MYWNILLLLVAILFSFAGVLVAFHFGKVVVYAYLSAYIGFAVAGLLLVVDLAGFPLAFMEIAYATWFLTTDIFSEHYGKKEAQRLVIVTAVLLGFLLLFSQLLILLTPHASDFVLPHLVEIFVPLRRIMIVGVVVFLLEQLLDIYLFEKIRNRTQGKFLWLRNCGSTLSTQAFDVLIFYPLAFYGTFPLLPLMLTAYAFKAAVAFIDTPFLYLSYRVRPKELIS